MKKNKQYIWMAISILALIIMSIGCTGQKQENQTLSKTEFLMDTVMTVKVFENASEELMEQVFERIREIEGKMSYTIKGSDVNLINQNAGIKPVMVDKETYFVLEKAKEYAELSEGYYDPTVGPLVEVWDIKSGELDRESLPREEDIRSAMELIDYNKLELLDEGRVYLKDKGMKLNLGSIAKGYAADQVKKVLESSNVKGAIIDLGGNVFAFGSKSGEAWKIGVQDPNQATGIKLGILNVKNKSIVSSGSYERYFTYNNKNYHHILNPKTGYPSENQLMGVTIVSERSIDGDAMSTAIFVLGLENGKELIGKLEGIEAIFITSNDEVHISEKYKDEAIFTDLEPEFKLITY